MPRDDLPFCECRWLERAAHDPNCPIVFDSELNEYHLKRSDGISLIYHCPFCAGRAPESLRPQMFATVPDDETIRLHRLTKDLKTEDEVRLLLGEPTRVFEPGWISGEPDKEGNPGEIRARKSLRYENHSETAEINVNVDRYGKIRVTFSGKYIGKPSNA